MAMAVMNISVRTAMVTTRNLGCGTGQHIISMFAGENWGQVMWL